MRWLFASWGSQGDLHPFLALGQGLIKRGHHVTLVGNPDWREDTQEAGLKFISSGEASLAKILRDHPEILSQSRRGLTSLQALVNHGIMPGLDRFYDVFKCAARNHDVMVAHHFVFAAPLVAEQTGIPWATVALSPGVTPSAYTLPGPNFSRITTGWRSRLKNRMTWEVGKRLIKPLVDPQLNFWRLQRGGLPQHNLFHHHSPDLYLHLFSESFYSRPPDWSGEKQMGGFCFYDPPQTQLSTEIEDFLSTGEAPVLCTLGSAAVQNPGPFYVAAGAALQELGLRGLMLIGEERNRPAQLPASILAVPYAPFGLLMPRVKAVIHQGGIGTLAQALRAGKASLICPYAFDQPNNARRAEVLGVGIALAPQSYDKQEMVAALKKIQTESLQREAERWKAVLQKEDGVGVACNVLEKKYLKDC